MLIFIYAYIYLSNQHFTLCRVPPFLCSFLWSFILHTNMLIYMELTSAVGSNLSWRPAYVRLCIAHAHCFINIFTMFLHTLSTSLLYTHVYLPCYCLPSDPYHYLTIVWLVFLIATYCRECCGYGCMAAGCFFAPRCLIIRLPSGHTDCCLSRGGLLLLLLILSATCFFPLLYFTSMVLWARGCTSRVLGGTAEGFFLYHSLLLLSALQYVVRVYMYE